MNLDWLIEKLKETNFPVAYSHFQKEDPPTLPYIAVRIGATDNFFADNSVFNDVEDYSLEYCFIKKNPQQEKILTDKLDEIGVAWQKTSEEYIDDEQIYSSFYEFKELK